jgi:hypothetical protein
VLAAAFVLATVAAARSRTLLAADSLYYYGRSLVYAGYSREDALAMANAAGSSIGARVDSVERMFDWSLVEPRVLYSLLSAPFVRPLGWHGLLVVSITANLAFFALLAWALRRRYGTLVGLVTTLLVMCGTTWFFFATAALTESLSALLFALALGAAWRSRNSGQAEPGPRAGPTERHRPWKWGRRQTWLAVAALAMVAFAFTRQAQLIPAGALFAAWLGEWARVKRWRNSWLAPAAVIVGASAACQVLQMVVYPYDPGPEWRSQTDSSGGEGLTEMIWHVGAVVKRGLTEFVYRDPGMTVAVLLLAVSLVACWRRAEVHLAVGALAAGFVYQLLNGSVRTALRYCQPGWFAYALAVAAALAWFGSRVSRVSAQVDDAARPSPMVGSARASVGSGAVTTRADFQSVASLGGADGRCGSGNDATDGRSRRWLREWGPASLPCLVAAAFSTVTYFFYVGNGGYGMQAGIAAGIGWRITEGDALYADVWENKGPLYYLINALGVSIDYWHGIYWLELAALLVTAGLMYRLAAMLLTPWLAAVAAALALASLARTLAGGNLVEEWAMPMLALAAWAAFRAILDGGRRPVRRGLALGLAIAGLLAMRPNLAAFASVAALGVAWYLAWRGVWRRLWLLVGTAVAACCALLGALALWLASQGALAACLEGAYFDVVHWAYSADERQTNATIMLARLTPGGGVAILGLFAVGAAALVIRRVRRSISGLDGGPVRLMAPERFIVLVTTVGLAANFVANLISGNPDPNYMMTFVPLLAWPSAWLIAKAVQGLRVAFGARLVAARSVAVATAVALMATAVGPTVAAGGLRFWRPNDASRLVGAVASFLDGASTPDQRVALIGLPPAAHYASRRAPATARFYQPMSTFEDGFKRDWNDDTGRDLLEGRADLVVFADQPTEEAWLDDAVSPALGQDLRAMLARDYRPEPNDHGWLAYVRR